MLLDPLAEVVECLASEAAAAIEPDGVKPGFGLVVAPLDRDVRRFAAIAGVEEQTIRSRPKHGWHQLNPRRPTIESNTTQARLDGVPLMFAGDPAKSLLD